MNNTLKNINHSDSIMQKNNSAAIFSSGIKARSSLLGLLSIGEVVWKPRTSHLKPDFVVGWGRKGNTKKARKYAQKNDLSYYSLEDGFLHSVGYKGVLGQEGVSVVVDKSGIYYDATQPSDLETLIAEGRSSDPLLIQRAKKCIEQILEKNISKYNASTVSIDQLNLPEGKKILLVDQTAGDMSLKYGYVNDHTFQEMLQAALDEHPDAHIIIKTHVAVITGKKKGCLTSVLGHNRVIIVSENVNPLELIKQVDHVYVASSQMGFEALMAGKPVSCFGVPFYSQWGLTDDRGHKLSRRKRKCSLEEIFAAAYILYPCYIHLDTGEKCELEDVLDHFEYLLDQKDNDSNEKPYVKSVLSDCKKMVSGFINKFS